MNNHLYILTSFNFNHISGAAWSRVNNYAECLQNTGTIVYITSSAFSLEKEQLYIRSAKDTYLIQSSKLEKNCKSYIQQIRFSYYYKHYVSIYKLSLKQEASKKVFLLYSFNLASITMALLVFRILKRQTIYCEKNELQFGIALNQPLAMNIKRYIPSLILKILTILSGFLQDAMTIHFNGIIVISKRFMKLYSKTNKKIIKIPILANNIFFKFNKNVKTGDEFKICYTGDINQNKDGILDFLKAINSIRYIRLNCDFYGNINNEFRPQLIKMLQTLESFHSITIHDMKPHTKVPEILSGYDLLILPRPKNIQTLYGFSTKLAEYLASSVPVLASRISDNDLYIEDGINGFLYEAGNIETLSLKIREIVSIEDDKLAAIGLSGRDTAHKHFAVSKYSSILKSFLFN